MAYTFHRPEILYKEHRSSHAHCSQRNADPPLLHVHCRHCYDSNPSAEAPAESNSGPSPLKPPLVVWESEDGDFSAPGPRVVSSRGDTGSAPHPPPLPPPSRPPHHLAATGAGHRKPACPLGWRWRGLFSRRPKLPPLRLKTHWNRAWRRRIRCPRGRIYAVRLPAGVLRGVLTAARLGLQGAALAARWADIGAGAVAGALAARAAALSGRAEPWQQVVGVGDGGSSCRQWWLRTVCGDVTRLVESGPALCAA